MSYESVNPALDERNQPWGSMHLKLFPPVMHRVEDFSPKGTKKYKELQDKLAKKRNK